MLTSPRTPGRIVRKQRLKDVLRQHSTSCIYSVDDLNVQVQQARVVGDAACKGGVNNAPRAACPMLKVVGCAGLTTAESLEALIPSDYAEKVA
eukprot:scaffold1291_cov412-Prasinococcus_capsulatus_cf.AAC.20